VAVIISLWPAGHIDPASLVNGYDDDQGEDVTMSNDELLARSFEAQRGHLQALALRLLGSRQDADEAVQEAWLRLSRTDADAVHNLGGWLTTVVGRICLDMLRARAARPEVVTDEPPEPAPAPTLVPSPEEEALAADSVGLALLVVLDTLDPAERLAFVLHDTFGVPFEEIAPIVGRTPTAARKLASRARRRLRSDPTVPATDATAQRTVVSAFLKAAREGDFAALLQLLDPDVVLRADPVAVAMARDRAGAGAPALDPETRGADAVMRVFAGRARAATPALVDGLPGAVWAPGGRPAAAFCFVVRDGRVANIELLSDPEALADLEIEPSGRASGADAT
jgi:RNA polymerase sigma-70 factor (ECF subfamily)